MVPADEPRGADDMIIERLKAASACHPRGQDRQGALTNFCTNR